MRWFGDKLVLFSATILGLLTLIMCIDVILRFFRYPIPGGYDIVEFLTSIMLAFATLKSFQTGTQIKIDLIDKLLSKHRLRFVELLSRIMTAIFLAILSVSLLLSGLNSKASGEVSMTLGIPSYLSYMAIGLCVGFAFLNEASPLWERMKPVERVELETRGLGREKA